MRRSSFTNGTSAWLFFFLNWFHSLISPTSFHDVQLLYGHMGLADLTRDFLQVDG